MADVILVALLAAVSLTLYFAWMAYFGSLRFGRCTVRRDGSRRTAIETDLGRYTLDHNEQLRIEPVKGAAHSISLEHIRAIRFAYSERPAVLAELMFGFDAWDLFGRWRDRMEWYEVSLVTQTGDVPIYVVGQLERREPFAQWWFDLINGALERVHMRDDVHQRSLRVLDELRKAFSDAGRPLPLA